MGWRILYIDEGEYLSLYLDNIKIKNKEENRELVVPIHDLHTLIVDNYRTVLSTHLMNALTKYNVNVVFCNVSHMPQSLLVPVSGNKNAPLMLRKQLAWNEDVKHTVHQSMVKAKIVNQIELLAHADIGGDTILRLKEFVKEVMPGDRTNREGLAAKMYFRALFGPSFKRFAEDVLNAGLNYGYSIFRSQISKTVLAKGMNPCIAFFHQGPNNQFNLSDDFLEPFRPLVDHYVYENLRDQKLLNREHKMALIRQSTLKVRFNGKKQTFFNAANQYVDTIVSFAETGDHDKLRHPVIDFHDL